MDLSLFWYHAAWVKQATLNSTYFKMGNSLTTMQNLEGLA